jgi:restriction system protein
LLGVLSGDQTASKAILTTTPDFAPKIKTDPFIKPFLRTRLELMNGNELLEWLVKLAEKNSHKTDHFVGSAPR